MNVTTVSGKIFNERYNGKRVFSVLLKEDSIDDYGHICDDGVNEDTNILITNYCSEGGFYFFDERIIGRKIKDCHHFIAKVSIPNDAIVFIDGHQSMKCNKLIVENKVQISDFYLWDDEDFCKNSAYLNKEALKYVKKNKDELSKMIETTEQFTHDFCKRCIM